MASVLLFRVQSPQTGSLYVHGQGILTAGRVFQRARGVEVDPLLPLEHIAPPHEVTDTCELVRHLRGDPLPTTFISTSTDIFRVLLFAKSFMQKYNLGPTDLTLFVIERSRLNRPVIDCPEYLSRVPQDISANIRSFEKVHRTVNINSEVVISGGVPMDAIVAYRRFDQLLPFIPPWIRDGDTIVSPPSNSFSTYRSWLQLIRTKHSRAQNENLPLTEHHISVFSLQLTVHTQVQHRNYIATRISDIVGLGPVAPQTFPQLMNPSH